MSLPASPSAARSPPGCWWSPSSCWELISTSLISLDMFPSTSVPVLQVTVPYPDASPAEVERRIVRPLEEGLGTVRALETIRCHGVAEPGKGGAGVPPEQHGHGRARGAGAGRAGAPGASGRRAEGRPAALLLGRAAGAPGRHLVGRGPGASPSWWSGGSSRRSCRCRAWPRWNSPDSRPGRSRSSWTRTGCDRRV
jgi:hypothetical protein